MIYISAQGLSLIMRHTAETCIPTLKKFFRAGLIHIQIVFKPSNAPHPDSDFASDEDDRKSYTGYVFLICGGAVSWSTHKQHTVALSSMEAEYMALSDAAHEALARKQFFCELQIPSGLKPITMLSDSQSALDISENPAKYRQAKHIDIRYHAIRHYIHDAKIQVDYIPSEHQPADLFTKALESTKHQRFCRTIGLRNSYEAFHEEVF